MFQPDMFESHHLLDMVHKPPENELEMIRDMDEFESKSGTDMMQAPSGDDHDDPNQRPKKKRYHRHTQHQIQEMESFFTECPHPDDKQRKDLGRRLGLEPLQVKFWFQNKRTQMKAHHERHENSQLRAENEKLRAENIRYKEALSNATCPNCGGPAAIGEMSFDEQHLRIDNVRLREEIDRISGIAAKYVGKPMLSYPHGTSRSLDLGVGNFGAQPGLVGDLYGAGDLLRSVSGPTEADKPLIIELAVAAMEEVIRMAQAGEPLWMPSPDNSTDILSEDEYLRTFPRGIGPKPLGLKSEASRESAVVIMNHVNLVEILMDVMTAEFQVPSPLVPTRENYFVRYCKQHADGTWVVVDVSLDNLRPSAISRCRRRPSGCLIQELPNGYSKVIWVEHAEVDDRAVHNIYRPLVNSGLAFGAKRWVATLDRQCERLASAMANSVPAGDVGVITTPEGRKSMMKLAERMVMSFCAGVGASTAHTWTTLSGSGADDVRVMTRKSMDDPGRPPGIVLSAATSFWLPVPPKRVFDFLRDENSRSEWDILSNGGLVQEMEHIANGRDPGNSVSLLRVNVKCKLKPEQHADTTRELHRHDRLLHYIYAPVDIVAMNVVLNGGDPDYVALLPSGFAILPDGPTHHGGGIPEAGSSGSLLTVAFQILVDSVPTAKLSLGSVATVNSLIKCTVERIKSSAGGEKA
ncbi:protodermal factor 2 [Actinidia rufa]|uniref:Protodermal factor 2 n=1 Tax=Actinidia rufa TaxID=165716 RepID=A0A7J0D8T2_9ERIC|nr:protodermal factor 2 [Actinidia rufa]